MDSNSLKSALVPFFAECEKAGYKIEYSCLLEAYPGISNTSFFVQVQSGWMDKMGRYDVLNILVPILFKTTDVETRKSIFALQVIDSSFQFNCEADISTPSSQISGDISYVMGA